jgi:hypothetical protein
MMISLFVKGDSNKTEKFLHHLKELQIMAILQKYGDLGVQALASATPKDTGTTAESWDYEIEQDANGYTIYWTNDNYNQRFNVAINLQKGHGTGTGGYVSPTDFINPTMSQIFDQLADDAWREVTSL